MLKEKAEVISVEGDGLWVRSQSISACQSCRAKSGCGQKLLNQWTGETFDVFASYADGMSAPDFHAGDRVDIAIAPNAVVLGSVLVYGVPIIALVGFVAFFELFFGQHWALSLVVLGGSLGLSMRAVRAIVQRDETRKLFQPMVVGKTPSVVDSAQIISLH